MIHLIWVSQGSKCHETHPRQKKQKKMDIKHQESPLVERKFEIPFPDDHFFQTAVLLWMLFLTQN